MEEFRTTLIYFPSMTPSRSRWQQYAAKRQVMQHKPKRYSIAAALLCPGLSLCVEWSRPNKQLHELQCCGSRLCMFTTLPFLTIVAIFLFFSTHVFLLYSLRLWRDGNICQIPTGCTSGTRPSQYALISLIWEAASIQVEGESDGRL